MQIVPRNQWAGDIKPRGTPGRIVTPTPRVWLHHGATGASTIATARSYARYHIETRKWLDIGYSFLIAEGKVLEGRGAGRAGAHTSGDNDASHGVCLVGNYQSSPLADRDLDALVWLLRHGHVQGWWFTAALTGGHRDAPGASTGCPGDGAYRRIPTINQRAQDQEDDMTPEDRQLLEHVAMRSDQTNHAVGRLHRFAEDLASDDVSDQQAKRRFLRSIEKFRAEQ